MSRSVSFICILDWAFLSDLIDSPPKAAQSNLPVSLVLGTASYGTSSVISACNWSSVRRLKLEQMPSLPVEWITCQYYREKEKRIVSWGLISADKRLINYIFIGYMSSNSANILEISPTLWDSQIAFLFWL